MYDTSNQKKGGINQKQTSQDGMDDIRRRERTVANRKNMEASV